MIVRVELFGPCKGSAGRYIYFHGPILRRIVFPPGFCREGSLLATLATQNRAPKVIQIEVCRDMDAVYAVLFQSHIQPMDSVHACMCACVHVCTCARVHVCMCACLYVCLSVCMSEFACVRLHVCVEPLRFSRFGSLRILKITDKRNAKSTWKLGLKHVPGNLPRSCLRHSRMGGLLAPATGRRLRVEAPGEWRLGAPSQRWGDRGVSGDHGRSGAGAWDGERRCSVVLDFPARRMKGVATQQVGPSGSFDFSPVTDIVGFMSTH